MLDLKEIINLIFFFLPAFVPFVCAMILLVGFNDNISRTEMQLKKVLLCYFLSALVSWFTIFVFVHEYDAVLFVYLNTSCYLSSLLISVLFYHLIFILTKVDGRERCSPLHYLVPVLISMALLVWSFFIPFDVQVAICGGKGTIYPGYEVYSHFFLSKRSAIMLFSVIYTCLIFARVLRYMKIINKDQTLVRKPNSWIIFLLGLSVAWIVVTLCAVLVSRKEVITSMFYNVTIVLLCTKHIALLYNIIRRRFALYVVVNEPIAAIQPQEPTAPGTLPRRVYARRRRPKTAAVEKGRKPASIHKSKFEAYIRKQKPYLNPNLKITDVVEHLNVNRSYISGFINRTYGLNFNQYINQCRLAELDRLTGLPSMRGEDIHTLSAKAGFAGFRNYTRALEARKPGSTTNNTKE